MMVMQARLEQLKAELARHLAPILRDVPTSLFEELVNLTASIQYERESMRIADRFDEMREAQLATESADDASRPLRATKSLE